MGWSIFDSAGSIKQTGLSGEVLHKARLSGPSSDATATHNAWTQVDQSTTSIDVGSLADPANDRIVIQRSGYYITGASTRFRKDTQGHQIGVSVYKNGSQLHAMHSWEEPSASYSDGWGATTVRIDYLTAGDILTVYAWNYGASAGNGTIILSNTTLWAIELSSTQAVDTVGDTVSYTNLSFRGFKNATQSIISSTWTTVAFNDVSGNGWDTVGFLNTSTGVATVPADLGGLWLVEARGTFAASGTNSRGARLRVTRSGPTTTDYDSGASLILPTAGVIQHVGDSWLVHLVAGDTIEFQVWQNSGGPLNIQAGEDLTWFTATRLRG